MNENPTNRMYDLVEELRADIDFELDDVITHIVRDLPEDYFHRLKRKDQLIHLKALLAISFCQLEEEIKNNVWLTADAARKELFEIRRRRLRLVP